MNRQDYFNMVGEQMRCKRAVSGVVEELNAHIEDQKQDFLQGGMDETEAEAAAVFEMGDPVEVGTKMDEVHRPRMDRGMLVSIGVISVIGVVIQALIAGKTGAISRYGFVYFLEGIAAMLLICYFDYTKIAGHAKKLAGAFILFMLFIFLSDNIVSYYNGSRQFAMLPVIGPVNLKLLLTLFVPLYCGILYSYRGRGGRALIPGVLWMVPTLWIAWQIPSATMVITLLMSYAICLSIAVYRGWFCISVKKTLIAIWSVMVCMPILGTLLILWFGREYQIARLQAFAGVNVSTEGNSFVISNLQRILRESHLLGGSSVREVYTEALPDPGSFVLPFLTSYYGILVAVAVVAMLLFLLCSMMKKSLRQRNQVGMLMSSGCCVVFFVETFFWLLSNLGIVYIDSFCPFLNYGGTGTLVTYIMLGIILSVYRNENVLPVHIRVGQKSKTRLDL